MTRVLIAALLWFAVVPPLLLMCFPRPGQGSGDVAPSELPEALGEGCALGAMDALSGEDWRRLRDGEVLIQDREEAKTGSPAALDVQAVSLIALPPGQVWRTLVAFENWPGFMPLIRESLVTRRDAGRVWVRQRYRVLFLNLEHTSIYALEPAQCEIRWKLDRVAPHDIAATQGRWRLLPVDGGGATLVVYRGAIDAGRAVPDFVERMLTRRSLPRMHQQLRVQALQGLAPVSARPD